MQTNSVTQGQNIISIIDTWTTTDNAIGLHSRGLTIRIANATKCNKAQLATWRCSKPCDSRVLADHGHVDRGHVLADSTLDRLPYVEPVRAKIWVDNEELIMVANQPKFYSMLVLLGKGLLVILEWGQKVESDEGAQKEVEWRLVPFIRFNQQSPSCLSGATPHRQTPLNINMSQFRHSHKTGVELLFPFEFNPPLRAW